MKYFRYKTNLKSDDCIVVVKHHLERVPGLLSWEVDLHHPDRTLTAGLSEDEMKQEVEEAIRQAGYEAIEMDCQNDIGY